MIKKFNSPIKLPGGGETKRCFYPFKLDTYGCGCANNCSYCYAKSVLSFRGLWDSDSPRVADISDIRKIFADVLEKKKPTKFAEIINAKIPARLGGMTDCFSDAEKISGRTREVIKMLNEYDYPYLILTKNILLLDYLDILRKDLAYPQYTITTPFDDQAKLFEPGASSSSERLSAIKTLSSEGFWTAVRINPLFPIHKDGYYSKPGSVLVKDTFKYFDWSLVDKIGEARASTLIAGFLRLSTWNIRWIKEATGEDLRWLFSEQKQSNTALHFSTEEKRYYYERIKKMCDKNGVEFSVCYDGDDVYTEFKYLWANQDDCCNGKGKVAGFVKAYDFLSPEFIK